MQSFYTQNKQDRWKEEESDDEAEIQATVRNRKPYHYSLSERFKAALIVLLCCCFKQKPWYKRSKKRQHDFNQGMEQLKQEVDLVQLIEMNRFLKFFIAQQFPKHQVELVSFFQKYCIDDFGSTKLWDLPSFRSAREVMEAKQDEKFTSFDTNDNNLDREIWKEIVGRDWEKSESPSTTRPPP